MKRTRLMLLFGSLRKPMPQYLSKLAQYAAQLLSQAYLFDCLCSRLLFRLQNLAAGFLTRPLQREAQAVEHCHRGCHYIFTWRQKKHCTNAPHEIAPTGIDTHSFCRAKHTRFLASATISPLPLAECHIKGSITGKCMQRSLWRSAAPGRFGRFYR